MSTNAWIAIGVGAVGVVAAAWAFAKRLPRSVDLGTVSSSWLAEHRANTHDQGR